MTTSQHIQGIGGVFLRAADPAALQAWYADILGVEVVGALVWQQQAGPTVVAPFPEDTDYFGRAEQQFMLNFRVADLDGLVAKLRAKSIDVQFDPSWDSPEVGRFARIHDPDGNPIELWEPAAGLGQ